MVPLVLTHGRLVGGVVVPGGVDSPNLLNVEAYNAKTDFRRDALR